MKLKLKKNNQMIINPPISRLINCFVTRIAYMQP